MIYCFNLLNFEKKLHDLKFTVGVIKITRTKQVLGTGHLVQGRAPRARPNGAS